MSKSRQERDEIIAREKSYGFTMVNPTWAVSARGFETGFTGRYSMEYREGDRLLKIGTESLGPAAFIYLADARRWEPPHDAEPIPDEKRASIRENIAAAMRFLRTGYRFDS